MSPDLRRAIIKGATLGAYQAHAVFGGLAAVVMFAMGHDVLAAILGFGSLIGWLGWKRDFGFRINFSEGDELS